MALTGALNERVMVALGSNDIPELDKIMLEAAEKNSLIMDSPLHIACTLGLRNVVSAYLDAGQDINSVQDYNNTNESTPLIAAVSFGRDNLVDFLLSKPDLDVNAKNPEGQSAFHVACAKNKLSLVKLILDHRLDVDVNSFDSKSDTPLMTALSLSNTQVVDYLLSPAVINGKKLDVNACYKHRQTALIETIMTPNLSKEIKLKYVMLLIEFKANVHAVNKEYNQTALDLAREKGLNSIVNFLEPITENTIKENTAASYRPVFNNGQSNNSNNNNEVKPSLPNANEIKQSKSNVCCLIL